MNIKRLLKNKNYCLFWVASAICMAGSNIYQYILSLYVLEITGSSTLFAGMLSIIIIPQVLLMPFSGVLADRFRRIKMMSMIIFLEFLLLMGFFAVGRLYGTLTIPMIYALVVIMEIGEIFYDIPSSAIIPEIVEPELIKSAVSFSRIDNAIVNVSAPVIAALLYTHLSIYDALAAVALIFLFTFVLQKFIHPAYELKEKEKTAGNSFFADFRGGINAIADNAFLKRFVVLLPLFEGCFGAFFSVSVIYLFRQVYGLSAYAYSLYCSTTGIVSFIVPFLAMPFVAKYPARKIVQLSTAFIGLALLMITIFAFLGIGGFLPVIASVVAITLFDCFSIACAIPMQIAFSTLLQTEVTKDVLGRVMSVVKMLSLPGLAVGELIMGFMNDVLPAWVSLFAGAAGMLMASYLYYLATKQNKSPPRTDQRAAVDKG